MSSNKIHVCVDYLDTACFMQAFDAKTMAETGLILSHQAAKIQEGRGRYFGPLKESLSDEFPRELRQIGEFLRHWTRAKRCTVQGASLPEMRTFVEKELKGGVEGAIKRNAEWELIGNGNMEEDDIAEALASMGNGEWRTVGTAPNIMGGKNYRGFLLFLLLVIREALAVPGTKICFDKIYDDAMEDLPRNLRNFQTMANYRRNFDIEVIDAMEASSDETSSGASSPIYTPTSPKYTPLSPPPGPSTL